MVDTAEFRRLAENNAVICVGPNKMLTLLDGLEDMKTALEFYANGKYYEDIVVDGEYGEYSSSPITEEPPVIQDWGEIAKQALKKWAEVQG